MSKAVDNLNLAMKKAMSVRPKVGGFPFLAETLRQAGVKQNIWSLPSCQSIYLTELGDILMQMPPLENQMTDIPKFNREELIKAIRTDQAGLSTFPEFLLSTWQAGVVRYVVDFNKRYVAYYGCHDEEYIEEYPAVDVK